MTTQELVNAVILKATGKATILDTSSAKYRKVLGIANFYIRSWANEPDVDWNSLYDPKYSIGTVSATNSFDLDDDIRKISDTPGDEIRISLLNNADNYIHYQTVSADELQRFKYPGYVAQIGRTIMFNETFNANSQVFGGTIYLPVYYYPEELSAPTDEIPVDDPQWLVTICAAEYVRNDIVRQNQYPNLIAEANVMMQRMKDDNDAQFNQPQFSWQAAGANW